MLVLFDDRKIDMPLELCRIDAHAEGIEDWCPQVLVSIDKWNKGLDVLSKAAAKEKRADATKALAKLEKLQKDLKKNTKDCLKGKQSPQNKHKLEDLQDFAGDLVGTLRDAREEIEDPELELSEILDVGTDTFEL